MKHCKKIYVIFLVLNVFFSVYTFSQTRISSPYSRYGLGDLQNAKYIGNLAMGGIGIAFRQPSSVNYSNPASYTVFDTNAFVLETGINSQTVKLSTNNQNQRSNYTSLSHLAFGFPVTKWWGSSIGLLPYSHVGYKISNYETLSEIGKIKYLYEGSGGLNQFYVGNAFQLKNLSVGVNAAYIFGYLDRTSTVSSPDSIYYLALRLSNGTRINGFHYNFGLQYEKKINTDWSMQVGLVYSATAKLNAKRDSFAYTFFSSGEDYEKIKDTIIDAENTKGKINLPYSLGGGIILKKSNILLMGFDYQMQNWNNYSSFGEKDSLKNSWVTSFGMEYTPIHTNLSSYWKRVHYRVGARYAKTYLQLRNNQLSESAVSFGFGLPLKRSKTSFNIGFELGQRGTLENNLIKEQFGRIILNVSFNEFWFFKRRFE
ncbi:MAG TPA: hypothetical protein PKZ43_02665 [Bacteroidales bacterium]|nr:hypothetical protein [Bacteroidales bacterium]HQH18431.1 hypothetical protein [Bacteroidales bacterium]